MQRLAVLLIPCLAIAAVAAEPAPTPAVSTAKATAAWDAVQGEVSRLLDALDDNQFESRQRATQRLGKLVERPELGPALAAEFERRRQLPNTSFEVRAQLSAWLDKLPDPPSTAAELTAVDFRQLVAQLDSDNYAVRSGASDRLAAAAANPQLAETALDIFKERLASSNNSFQTQRLLQPLYEQARSTWLSSDPAGWKPVAVSDEQIARWLDDLIHPAPVDREGLWLPHNVATRELLDLLARDEYVSRLKAAIAARLAHDNLPDEAAARLKPLWDWTRPAMVAEIWRNHEISVLQHLLVNVPQQPAGADRPTYFDRIDDRTAHCVSGNSLAPGDYPVGIALSRTNPFAQTQAGELPPMFHLINLPTPRRRMIYQRFADTFLTSDYNRTEEARKLTEISQRTLDAILADKRLLAPCDVELLLQLDPQVMSRFAGEYFKTVDDGPCSPDPRPEDLARIADAKGPNEIIETPPMNVRAATDQRLKGVGAASQHGLICVVLAAMGTSEAGPPLLEAMRAGRISPPTEGACYQLPWIAALAIAGRDPWPEADTWLASLVDRTDQLNTIRVAGPELGAVAAGILLSRRGEDLADLGFFAEDQDSLFAGVGVRALRFTSEEKRQEFLRWWAKRQPSKSL